MSDRRTSWDVKGEAVLTELLTLIGLSEAECGLLGALGAAACAEAPRLTEAFYARLLAHANTAEYLQHAPMERLHGMVAQWFTELFSGVYDSAYVRRRLKIGAVHVQIGLPVRYPLAMLDVVLPAGEAVARQSPAPEQALAAFRKLLALDVAVFNQAYEDNQLAHLSDLVGGERLARRLLAGQA